MEQVILTQNKKNIDQVKQGLEELTNIKKETEAGRVKEMGEQWKKHSNSFFILNCHACCCVR
jgi:hypothetical protein